MQSVDNAPQSSVNTECACRSTNTPEGFSISSNVVPEEAWEEIRLYLGLTTTPKRIDEHNSHGEIIPSIEIDEFGSSASASTQIPWESTPFPQNRPVAQFGFRYDYEKDVVVPPTNEINESNNHNSKRVPEIPEVFQRLLLRPYQENTETPLGSVKFTQCIVNVYRPSTTMASAIGSKAPGSLSTPIPCTSSIPWHFDDPQFGPEILVFTFGETRPLEMRINNDIDATRRNGTNDADNFTYFTANPSHRSCYVLSGPARHKWQHSVPSGSSWRVSITFRTLCPP